LLDLGGRSVLWRVIERAKAIPGLCAVVCAVPEGAADDPVAEEAQRAGADYGCINDPPTWPHGLECEIFSFAWLERAAREAVRPSEREHVSPFIRNHPQARKINMPGPGPQTVRHRWTLDHADDLTFLRALWARLPEGPAGWSWRVPFAIVEADPQLAAINAGHERLEGLNKSLAEDARAGFAPCR
jgi:spore coat polysaccharide biosynthesis protein SpsF (cytidylyltransferase family)